METLAKVLNLDHVFRWYGPRRAAFLTKLLRTVILLTFRYTPRWIAPPENCPHTIRVPGPRGHSVSACRAGRNARHRERHGGLRRQTAHHHRLQLQSRRRAAHRGI